MVNHHGLEIIHHSGETAVKWEGCCGCYPLSASQLLSARLGFLWITRPLQIEIQTHKGQLFLLSGWGLTLVLVKVALKEHRHSENVTGVREDTTFVAVCKMCIRMYSVHVCVCVMFDRMWLLSLSSVQALKIGPGFTVISHPNGSCHILLPKPGWSTTKSQEEKRKLNRCSSWPRLSLALSEQKWLYGLKRRSTTTLVSSLGIFNMHIQIKGGKSK